MGDLIVLAISCILINNILLAQYLGNCPFLGTSKKMETAIGMAMAGLRPVAEMQFSGFSYLMMGQYEGHATRYRSRTQGQLTCPLVVRMPYGGGIHPPEHHSESYETLFLNSPGFKVVVPSNPYDAKGLLKSAIRPGLLEMDHGSAVLQRCKIRQWICWPARRFQASISA